MYSYFRESIAHMKPSKFGLAAAITILTFIVVVGADIVLWLTHTRIMQKGDLYSFSFPALALAGVLWVIFIPMIHWKWTLGYMFWCLIHLGIYTHITSSHARSGEPGALLVSLHQYVWVLMLAGGLMSWGISALVKKLDTISASGL